MTNEIDSVKGVAYNFFFHSSGPINTAPETNDIFVGAGSNMNGGGMCWW